MHKILYLMMLTSVLFLGCGGGGDGQFVLSGNVKHDGKPLPSGSISFTPPDGSSSYSGLIKDGHYEVNIGVDALKETGQEMLVAVTSWESQPTMGPEGKPVPGKEAIPKHYFDAKKSGLTASVSRKDRKFDFDLK